MCILYFGVLHPFAIILRCLFGFLFNCIGVAVGVLLFILCLFVFIVLFLTCACLVNSVAVVGCFC